MLTDICIYVRITLMITITRADSVRFTTKGQVVIPAWLRKEFHIEDGTRAVVQATPEGILLKPVTAALIKRGRGILKRGPDGRPLSEEWSEHKAEERELEQRHAR
jgi:AbrB family looped-hinge helix DNA binding protein